MNIFWSRENVINNNQMDFSASAFDSMQSIELRYQCVWIGFDMLELAMHQTSHLEILS